MVMVMAFVLSESVLGVSAQADRESGRSSLSGVTVDAEVRKEVAREYAGATIVEHADVDIKTCGTRAEHPGWIKADFNEDGRPDHAVLLMTRQPEKGPARVTVHVVVLLGDKNKGYRHIIFDRVEEAVPIIKYIGKQPPGTIHESEAVAAEQGEGRSVTLQNPGWMFISCQQYARVYYWDARSSRFEEIPTVD